MIPYEQSELSYIQKASSDASQSARFNTLLIVQHHTQTLDGFGTDGPFVRVSHSLADSSLNDFNPHAVMLMCQLPESGAALDIEMNFDTHVLDTVQAELVLGQFERIVRQLGTSMGLSMDRIDPVSASDLALIWEWNKSVPATHGRAVLDMIRTIVQSQPAEPAICSWDGSWTYQKLDDVSDHLARHLLTQGGVVRGAIIPLCFEKSRWMPVAALGVMKAGAASLAMDCTQPAGRLRGMIAKMEVPIILASSNHAEMARQISGAEVVVVVVEEMLEQAEDRRGEAPPVKFPTIVPTDVLYCVFTSGSTGQPKSILTTHENFALASCHQREALQVLRGSRVFDFVSYSFDVAWSNLLHTLICGACLCIPSDRERKNAITHAFNRLEADYAYFTPSVARSLDPMSMPGLKTLAMGGEPIPAAEVARWRHVATIIGIYGPAECAQALCITPLKGDTPSGYVGKSFGARTWLVKPGCPDVLVPVGAVGELLIEGLTVASGYGTDVELTAAAFLETPPTWLTDGAPGYRGREVACTGPEIFCATVPTAPCTSSAAKISWLSSAVRGLS